MLSRILHPSNSVDTIVRFDSGSLNHHPICLFSVALRRAALRCRLSPPTPLHNSGFELIVLLEPCKGPFDDDWIVRVYCFNFATIYTQKMQGSFY